MITEPKISALIFYGVLATIVFIIGLFSIIGHAQLTLEEEYQACTISYGDKYCGKLPYFNAVFE